MEVLHEKLPNNRTWKQGSLCERDETAGKALDFPDRRLTSFKGFSMLVMLNLFHRLHWFCTIWQKTGAVIVRYLTGYAGSF